MVVLEPVVVNAELPVNRSLLESAAYRAGWVQTRLDEAAAAHTDGVNFDLEDPAALGSHLARAYTALIAETAAAFHERDPGSQISVDVAWSPYGVDGRNYDVRGLAAAADLVFIMAYDMQSQIWGRCVASANSPLALVRRGVQQYLDLGVPASKLVLGLPWYGYEYPCEGGAPGKACMLKPTEFRGAPCSDAAGAQKEYLELMQRLARNATSGVLWDETQVAPYFEYEGEHGARFQVWTQQHMHGMHPACPQYPPGHRCQAGHFRDGWDYKGYDVPGLNATISPTQETTKAGNRRRAARLAMCICGQAYKDNMGMQPCVGFTLAITDEYGLCYLKEKLVPAGKPCLNAHCISGDL
ncbi:hypothetical protein WJX81_002090 [Elliptochloris bilobata]|uniref:GH18 domain-containing protein n=1 Tax=Elliptochloris bilobata TaxID=381761 RepID=A0AAW1S807_9CHLO